MQKTKIPSGNTECVKTGKTIFLALWVPALLVALAVSSGCGDDGGGTSEGPVTWTVNAAGDADFGNIQACINNANSGDTCLVYPGNYGSIRFYGKGINVTSTSGAEKTFLDGGGEDTVVRFIDGESNDSILNGFTVRNGSAQNDSGQKIQPSLLDLGSTEPGEKNGGGIKIWVASPLIKNCIITNNYAFGEGGGVFCAFTGSQPEFLHVVFQENTADGNGGGMSVFAALPDFTDCLFIGNQAGLAGTVYASYGADVLFSNCTLADNASVLGGDALYLLNAMATIDNSICWGRYWRDDGDSFSGQLAVLDLDTEQGGASRLALNVVDLEGRIDGGVRITENCTESRCGVVQDPAPVLIPVDPLADPDPVFKALYKEEEKDAHVSMEAYYLSQFVAGQPEPDSPCVDTGSESAVEAGLFDRTTQNGEQEENGEHVQSPDTGTVDLGYHYKLTYPEPKD